jgi:hypothetical protein
MSWMRSAVAVSVLAFAALPTTAAAQTPDATLPSNCVDQQIAPSSVVLACGDAGLIAQDLVWSDWGAAQASGNGHGVSQHVRSGLRHRPTRGYAVTLTASELRDCDSGKPQYTLVTYDFPAASPFPPESPGAENPTVEFRCPVRPHADPTIKRMRMTLTGHGPPSRGLIGVDCRRPVAADVVDPAVDPAPRGGPWRRPAERRKPR